MQSIEHFAPNLSGPASRQAPFCKTNEAEEAEARPEKELEEQEEEEEKMKEEEDGGCFRAPEALIAEENANAEYLIGLEESPQDCSVAKLAALSREAWSSE